MGVRVPSYPKKLRVCFCGHLRSGCLEERLRLELSGESGQVRACTACAGWFTLAGYWWSRLALSVQCSLSACAAVDERTADCGGTCLRHGCFQPSVKLRDVPYIARFRVLRIGRSVVRRVQWARRNPYTCMTEPVSGTPVDVIAQKRDPKIPNSEHPRYPARAIS